MSALQQNIRFHDFQPTPENFRNAVFDGLSRRQKRIPPKFFYNDRGSALFESILEQPEYYIPGREKAILEQCADELAALIGPDAVLIEPGSGSCEKVQLLLEDLLPAAYVPMDISGEFLLQAVSSVGRRFPWLAIHAACIDFTQRLTLPPEVPEGRRIAFIPGSSLGNFDPLEVQYFLGRLKRLVREEGGLLVGMDRKKAASVLHAAYNDAAGVTAEFNLNLLKRINNELDADFNRSQFGHSAFYNEQSGRIEMHLVSLTGQAVAISGEKFYFEQGESIHTENSYKYHPHEFIKLAQRAGFQHRACWSDEDAFFSIYFFDVL